MKDIGVDLRRNLITVPSCAEHNSKKSKDDEFLLAVLLMDIAGNRVGNTQFLTKLLRAARRQPNTYASFFRDKCSIAEGHGRLVQIDRARFDRCVTQIARDLFYHHYNDKWQLPIVCVSPSLYLEIENDLPKKHEPSCKIAEITRDYLQSEKIHGSNPEVFQYQVKFDPAENGYAFGAVFYEGIKVYSWSSSEVEKVYNK